MLSDSNLYNSIQIENTNIANLMKKKTDSYKNREQTNYYQQMYLDTINDVYFVLLNLYLFLFLVLGFLYYQLNPPISLYKKILLFIVLLIFPFVTVIFTFLL